MALKVVVGYQHIAKTKTTPEVKTLNRITTSINERDSSPSHKRLKSLLPRLQIKGTQHI